MLHPALARVDLPVRFVLGGNGVAIMIKNNETRGGGALVQGTNVLLSRGALHGNGNSHRPATPRTINTACVIL